MPSTITDRLNGLTTSVAVKPPCVAVASTNLTLSGLQTVGGVVLVAADRVLLIGQTNASENGIYTADTGDWTRAKDFDGARDAVQGTLVLVRNAVVDGAIYELTSANPITIGTSNITFALRYGTNISYDQTATEAAALVVPVDRTYPPGHARRYGLIGDGTNETTRWNNWTASCSAAPYSAYLPKASVTKYVIANVTIPSNIHIIMDQGAIVEAVSTLGANDRLLNINGSNVTIDASGAIVRMVRADYVTGEQRHGVDIRSATNVTITGLESSDCGGDGFYIGGGLGTPSANVVLRNCKGNNNRRQGLSITQCRRFRDIDGQWTNTTGTAPAGGIDIEPNSATDILEDIKLIRPRCTGNDGAGIYVALFAWNAITNYANIDIIEPYTSANGGVNQSGRLRPGIDINRIPSTTPCRGRIRVIDAVMEDEKTAGITVYDWDINGPLVDIIRPTVINPNQINGVSSIVNGGIILYNSGTHTATPGNVRIADPVIRDDDQFLFANTLTVMRIAGAWDEVEVINPIFSYAGANPWSIDATVKRMAIRSHQPHILRFNTTGGITMTDGRYLGRTITNNGAAGTLSITLLAATTQVGWRFSLELMEDQEFRLVPNAADKIVPHGVLLAAGQYLAADRRGSRLTVECREAGFWDVIEQTGDWSMQGNVPTPAYTETNVTTDRAYDADTAAVTELSDIVGTLIKDLRAKGLLG